MSAPSETITWRLVVGSATGSRHEREGRPNQDRSGAWAPDQGSRVAGSDGEDSYVSPEAVAGPVVVAVADGHGSERYTRSAKGAELAVSSAIEVLSAAAEPLAERLRAEEAAGQDRVAAEVARRIVEVWLSAVYADLEADPVDEGDPPEKAGGRPTTRASAKTVPYGTTLLASLVHDGVFLAVQIGDGALVAVRELGDNVGATEVEPTGEDAEPPARAVANVGARVFPASVGVGEETNSLCQPDSARFAQTHVSLSPPKLVMLVTDGFEKSFTDEAGFLASASDYLDYLEEPDGVATVTENLGAWLSGTSAEGAGDDTSLAIAFASGRTVRSGPEPAASGGPARLLPSIKTLISRLSRGQ